MKQRLFSLSITCLIMLSSAVDHISATGQQTDQPTDDPVLVGAGDIASCALDGDEQTAKLLDKIDGTVFAAGDIAYEKGTLDEFKRCYGPTWGRHRKRTRPSLGNHEYGTKKAQGYFDYFGKQAGTNPLGYYSYDLGEWHIIALNSSIDMRPEGSQGLWLKDDLEKHKTICTLAYWHFPTFSSVELKDVNVPRQQALWAVLQSYGVDVIVNGHVHWYERMAPQDAHGKADPHYGIRQFTVGTGGASLNRSVKIVDQLNSEVMDRSTWGVIKFTLHPTSYTWEFIPVEGGTFRDSGSEFCVGAPERASNQNLTPSPSP
jgi:acid phosphatase type 7